MSPLIVPCSACGTEGRIYHITHYDRDGNECGWIEDCSYCDGTGGEEIEAQPLDESDLNDCFGGPLAGERPQPVEEPPKADLIVPDRSKSRYGVQL